MRDESEAKRMSSDGSSRIRWLSKFFGWALAFILLALVSIPPGFLSRCHLNNRSRAKNQAFGLKHAILAYFTEYRRYPVEPRENNGGDTHFISDNALMQKLCPPPNQTRPSTFDSPREICFFDDDHARPIEGGKFGGGLRHSGAAVELFDPWGNYFHIIIDTNNNDRISIPAANGRHTEIRQTTIVWSAGPDGDPNTWDDNINTW
ncbi:MAG: hypothetical protein H7A53_00725 [Akkermansiaceae bacterium]|nr:hypothetical protein [Akkermansiaceae bacterium]MCP5549410.1 hypothetical protein [Akkermansiaceae bacterium]